MEKQIVSAEFRAIENEGKMTIRALVNNGDWSKVLTNGNGTKFREKIKLPVWQKTINESRGNVKLYVNHEDLYDVAQELRLYVTKKGLEIEATLKEGCEGLYNKIKQGIFNQMSFGFRALDDEWIPNGDIYDRIINALELFEISILNKTAAYNNTTVEARNLEIPNVPAKATKLEIERQRIRLMKVLQ